MQGSLLFEVPFEASCGGTCAATRTIGLAAAQSVGIQIVKQMGTTGVPSVSGLSNPLTVRQSFASRFESNRLGSSQTNGARGSAVPPQDASNAPQKQMSPASSKRG